MFLELSVSCKGILISRILFRGVLTLSSLPLGGDPCNKHSAMSSGRSGSTTPLGFLLRMCVFMWPMTTSG